jgi:hypothetical protein
LLAFIVLRDRVSYARQCVAAMDAAGLEPVIVDHGSTWPEAVEWLAEQKKAGVTVIDSSGHPRGLWEHDWFRQMCGSDRYVVNDPDVVPSEDCPLDWPQRLSEILDRHMGYHKAGLGLRIDRIPHHFARRNDVIGWESHFWDQSLEDNVFVADVDTTLALHQPLSVVGTHSMRALRTGFPYVADHLAWYEDYGNLPGELQHYYAHGEPGVSCWTPVQRPPFP